MLTGAFRDFIYLGQTLHTASVFGPILSAASLIGMSHRRDRLIDIVCLTCFHLVVLFALVATENAVLFV